MKSCPFSLQVKKGSGLQQNICIACFYRNSYLLYFGNLRWIFCNSVSLSEEIRDSKNMGFEQGEKEGCLQTERRF